MDSAFLLFVLFQGPGAPSASKPIFESHSEKQALSLHQHAKEQLPITARESAFHIGKAMLKLAFPFESFKKSVLSTLQ